jgi:hypothetical protein
MLTEYGLALRIIFIEIGATFAVNPESVIEI